MKQQNIMIELSIGFLLTVSVVFAVDPCRFEDSELGVIDLTTLGRTDDTATYADIVAAGSGFGTLTSFYLFIY